MSDVRQTLEKVANLYPPELVEGQILDIDRVAFNIEVSLSGRSPSGLTICDVGGGGLDFFRQAVPRLA